MLTSKVFPPSRAGVQIESAQIGDSLNSSLDMTLSGLSRKYCMRLARIPGSLYVCPFRETSRRGMSMVVPFIFTISCKLDELLLESRRFFMRFARTVGDVCLPATTSVTPQSKSFSSVRVITLSIMTMVTVFVLCRWMVAQKGKICFPKMFRFIRMRR